MNNRINITTDDVLWAMALAGAARSALGEKRDVNPGFQISFAPRGPVIARLSQYFGGRLKDGVDLSPPSEEHELRDLDALAARKRSEEAGYMHGTEVEADYSLIQGYTHLAETWLLFKAGVVSEPAFWYPRVSQSEYEPYLHVSAIAMDESLVPFAQGYLEGFGTPGHILVPKDLDEAIRAVNSPSVKVVVGTRTDPMNAVLRAYYETYDRIADSVPMLLVLEQDDLGKMGQRQTISWPGQLALFRDEGPSIARERGETWSKRAEVGFDLFEFIRRNSRRKG